MKRGYRFVSGCVMAGFALSSANAKELDVAKLCGGARQVTPVNLITNAAGAYDIHLSLGVWNADGNGNDMLQDKAQAIFRQTYCDDVGETACADGDQAALWSLDEALTQFFSDPRVSLETIREPTKDEFGKWPMLGSNDWMRAFDNDGRFVTIRCRLDTDTSGAMDDGGTGGGGGKAKPAWSFDKALRITKTIDGLSLARGDRNKLASVPQADISFVDDRVGKTRTFNIEAVLGFDLLPETDRTLIPFGSFKRVRTGGAGAVASNDISQWGFGLMFGSAPLAGDEWSATAVLAADDVDHSRVGSLRASWRPGFLQDGNLPFGGASEYGSFTVMLDARMLAQGGHVFEPGTNADLIGDRGFLRAGPEGKAKIWFLPTDPVFSHFTFDASYKYMFNLSGPQAVSWLDVGLNYVFDKEGHWALRYSYEKGDDDETLKRTDQWKLSLGIRY